jgi:methylmalonyl-CoA/ethylmalonyl-CoA epimerase
LILGIDHVGLATPDMVRAGAQLAKLGLARVEAGEADAYGVACEFWQFDSQPSSFAVELVAPTREDSAVGGRLAKSGPGLYHIALEVDDLEAEMDRLRANGCVPVDAEPCAGARDGMTVAFMYLGKPVNLMVELVRYERPRRPAPTP